MTNLVLLRFPLLTVFCLLFHFAGAQQCEFRVLMEDIYGDGWNDGLLTVTSGPDVYTFTLLDGYDSTVTFSTNTGAPLKLSWTTGEYDDEVTLSLFNNDGDLLYSVTEPGAGTLYQDTAECVECLRPLNVVIENVYDTRARIRWTPGVGISMPVGWWVIYGPPGFTPGPGAGDSLYAALPKATITGLEKKTFYDFYVQQDCGNGQTGSLSGPYTFETYRSDDVGISGIVSPESGCDLGIETVTIRMSNYGANPLSLIPFNYSVNGIPGGVPQPQDGFYTGVIGKDSTTTIEFETMFDFSGPGEYLIEAWTEMEGDEFSGNDTFRIRIVNYLVAPYEQDFETWSGGWYVDTSA
ncbi:MAG: fibronectin type III domain-containing protein, partial [Thermoanaerobaculia bacterium]|nr:fibronectin type III domain-containing protein [Thermoanaerobaculia bacterium]